MRAHFCWLVKVLFLVSSSAAFSPPNAAQSSVLDVARARGTPSPNVCQAWRRTVVPLLRKPANHVAIGVPLLPCAKQSGEGQTEDGKQTDMALTSPREWPFVRSVVAFGKWLVASFRSLLVMRLSWLLHATTRIKHALLDPKTPLENPAPTVAAQQQQTLQAPLSSSSSTTTTIAREQPSAAQAQQLSDAGVTQEDVQRKMDDIERLMSKSKNEPTVEVACQSFWDSLSQGTSPSVETTLAKLQEESEKMQQRHALELQNAAGVHLSVLDFVLDGGMPPSVEALTAWLQYRGIDTEQWGTGEAKSVQDFFHEIWAGECEPLTDLSQRCISVVKVRIVDEDEKGTWQLCETKQKFCRDGRTRPRNKPLAEKKRPRETPEETAVRGVVEELGSELDENSAIEVDSASLEEWVECRTSNSFPGLETVYKLYQVDVKVEGLTRARTGTSFESVETPNLSTGKVHSWTWKPSGGVDWQPVDPLKPKTDPPTTPQAQQPLPDSAAGDAEKA